MFEQEENILRQNESVINIGMLLLSLVGHYLGENGQVVLCL